MIGGLDVSGGVGGVGADTDDMTTTAAALHRVAGEIDRVAGRSRGAAHDGDLLASAALSPATAARAEAALLSAAVGPHGLLLAAVRVHAQGLVLTTRVRLLHLADAGRLLTYDVGNQIGATLIGRALLPVGVPMVLADYSVHLQSRLLDSLTGAVTGRTPWSELDDELRSDVAEAGADVGDEVFSLLLDHPEITDVLAGGSSGLVRGALSGLGPAGRALLPLVPPTYEGMLVRLRQLVGATGGFQDAQITLTRAPGPPRRQALENLEGVLRSQASLMQRAGGDSDDGFSTLRVLRVPQPDGTVRFVLAVPGTQHWDPWDNRDPSDLTSTVTLMEGTDPALLQAMAQALRSSGYEPGQQVMLAGHSQGGIAAAAFAADPVLAREFDVTMVVTAGSPIARVPLPDDVQVLSLENSQDPVPRLEGRENPDRPGWITSHLDTADPGLDLERLRSPVDAHGTDAYAGHAHLADISDDPSLVRFRTDAQGFFLPAAVTDYDMHR